LNDIDKRSIYDFDMSLEKPSGESVPCYLTNWDSEGCFVIPREKAQLLKGTLTIKIFFENSLYQGKGQAISSFGDGVGIRFYSRKESGNFFTWGDFFKILEDRGYRPKG
jgi:hypothetical protein